MVACATTPEGRRIVKVSELLEALSEFPEDAEVRLASQPSWPMDFRLDGPTGVQHDDETDAAVVYLTEAEHVGYLPGFVARELGWR
jgi:hypothetical protein